MAAISSWLPFARASAVGWVPLAKTSLPKSGASHIAVKSLDDSGSGRKVSINVSGRRFEAWRATLEKFPDTLLGSDEKEFFYDEINDQYFLDRDPDNFKNVLNYYRTGKMHFPRTDCIQVGYKQTSSQSLTGRTQGYTSLHFIIFSKSGFEPRWLSYTARTYIEHSLYHFDHRHAYTHPLNNAYIGIMIG